MCLGEKPESLSYRDILACPWRAGVPQEQPSPLEGIENQRGRGVPPFRAFCHGAAHFPQRWDAWHWLAPEWASTRDASVTCFTKPPDTVACTTESRRRGVIAHE